VENLVSRARQLYAIAVSFHGTYIWMPPDLLDDVLVKVSGIAQEVLSNVVGVLQSSENIIQERKLAALPQLCHLELSCIVDILHPAVVVLGAAGGNVLLELDDVLVGNDLRVLRGVKRSSITVDALVAEGRRGRSASC
jgi:hypothetical protein